LEETFAALDEIWGDKYPYPPRRFANLLKCFTHTLWAEMSSLIPKVSPEAKANIILVE